MAGHSTVGYPTVGSPTQSSPQEVIHILNPIFHSRILSMQSAIVLYPTVEYPTVNYPTPHSELYYS